MKQYLYLFVLLTLAFLGSNKIYADTDNVEQELAMRVQQAQVSGSDSDFYEAQQTYMDYLERRQEWEKYYRTWMNRVIYEVNHKHFHRAFIEILLIILKSTIRSVISTSRTWDWAFSTMAATSRKWARSSSGVLCRA